LSNLPEERGAPERRRETARRCTGCGRLGEFAEGWRSGAKRDDDRKETPALVQYEELSESEKAHDRENAIATLKTIIALGGCVEAPRTR
jgi:hypothetical protein